MTCHIESIPYRVSYWNVSLLSPAVSFRPSFLLVFLPAMQQQSEQSEICIARVRGIFFIAFSSELLLRTLRGREELVAARSGALF